MTRIILLKDYYERMFKFLNRTQELADLQQARKKGGLAVVIGRRRIGKTRLLKHWLSLENMNYSQSIEGQESLQIEQIYHDVKDGLKIPILPQNWSDFFKLLEKVEKQFCLCIDEFPYLVQSSPSLPSILQKWLDHQNHHNSLIILSGSSLRMMNQLFLNSNAPLYNRANRILNVQPMSYEIFCRAFDFESSEENTFMKYSLVGGVPKYWDWIEKEDDLLNIAEQLYFRDSSFFEQEPKRLLAEENVHGLMPSSVLEAIGRGSHRPSEIAQRLNVPQQNLSKIFQLLLDIKLIEREVPFGENEKNAKKTLYRILDPACHFWYQGYSPHRSRWRGYTDQEKMHILRLHSSQIFEHHWRSRHIGSKRYWEPQLEFDSVREENGFFIVSEVKFKKLTEIEKKKILSQLEEKWKTSKISKKYQSVRFEVVDTEFL